MSFDKMHYRLIHDFLPARRLLWKRSYYCLNNWSSGVVEEAPDEVDDIGSNHKPHPEAETEDEIKDTFFKAHDHLLSRAGRES
jgi:hypothetical protein